MRREIFGLALIMLLSYVCHADVLHMKNGRDIEVEDAYQDGNFIRCTKYGATISYPIDSVKKIDKGITQSQKDAKQELNLEEIYFKKKPKNIEKIILDYLHVHLKDPYSIKDFTVTEPRSVVLTPEIIPDRFDFLIPGQTVWLCTVYYNAKNSYGAYTGIKKFLFMLRGESVVKTYEE